MVASSPYSPIPHASGARAASARRQVAGSSVAQILRGHCQAHAEAAGIVIARLDARAGVWQYSVDEGASWREARTDLINRPGAMGLALDREARLRLLPRGAERAGPIHIVLYPVQHSLQARNGSHSAYVPDPSNSDARPVNLVLDMNGINGAPPQARSPLQRNKRAQAQAAVQARVPARPDGDGEGLEPACAACASPDADRGG
jgi:hypothetical protein